MGPRLVITGVGANVWQFHAPGIAAIDADVVAVHDIDPERAQSVADDLDCPVAHSLDDLLSRQADLAVVLAPHRFHADLVVACLRAGHHVFVEKPLTVTMTDADRMCDEADRQGKLLAVAFQQRTRTEVIRARELIATGALGDLQRADLLATWPRRSSYFATAPWRGTWHGEGGGVLVNQGHHDLDILCHIVGQPAAVTARTRTVVHPIETEDTAVALAEWPNGAVGTIRISTAETGEPQRLDIVGTGGRLRLTPGRLEFWRNAVDFRRYATAPGDPYAAPQIETVETMIGGDGRHLQLYENLVAAMAGKEEPVASGRDAALTTELAAALIMSGRRRREVCLPVDRVEYDALLTELTTR
jgi:predicted dehydrogenase